MSLLNNIPTELPYYGLKWRLYYTNVRGRTVDLSIYKRDYTGMALSTEDLLDITTEDGKTLTPAFSLIWRMLSSEVDVILAAEDGKGITLGKVSEGIGYGVEDSLPITYANSDVALSQSIADGDFFKPISGSSMQLNIHAFDKDEFADLRDAENFEFYFVIKLEDNLINAGYIVPETYRQDWGELPHLVSVQATDGLGLLRDIPFTHENDEDVKGIHRVSDAISYVLYKAGNRGKWYDATIYVPNEASSKGRKFAWNTYIDMGQWKDKPKCHEVLEDILESINAQIIRFRDGFLIRHIDDNRENIPAVEYDAHGAFIKGAMIMLPVYNLQVNSKFIGRSMLQTEKPMGSIELEMRRYLLEDLSQPEPPLEWVEHEWMPGWEKGEIIKPKEYKIKQAPHSVEPPLPGQVTDIGLLIKDVIDPIRYRPNTNQYMELTADISVEWISGWESVTIPNTWYMGITEMNGDQLVATHWIEFDPSISTKQSIELVFRTNLANNIRLFFHPIAPIFSDFITWQVDYILFENWKLRLLQNKKGDDYEDEPIIHEETYHPNNRTKLNAVKHLGFFPEHPFGALIWDNVYMCLVHNQYKTVMDWYDGSSVGRLHEFLLVKYAAYYAFNKYRYSVTIAHLNEIPLNPLRIVEDNHIDQVFRITSMRMIPKTEQYVLELIGFELK